MSKDTSKVLGLFCKFLICCVGSLDILKHCVAKANRVGATSSFNFGCCRECGFHRFAESFQLFGAVLNHGPSWAARR
jgi:hypothetical protein